MMAREPAVYILASERHGTLYTGVTSDLIQRVWQNKNDVARGFSERYQVHSLVYFEYHQDMDAAILREKKLNKWGRSWKIQLIESVNPEWRDLWADIQG